MSELTCFTPNDEIRHGGEKLIKTVPVAIPEMVAVYFEKMKWGQITPDAEALYELPHLTVDPGVVDNLTGQKVFQEG